ncbi:hypothetical protein TSH7_03060 [Azospirillum sp. TSH7]|jgi:hypothetical protein|uniref:hypothetical protein n=1 Tax=unclassified Azospirillum TaxID=2630922 RepID=UPI000D60F85D|nr:MULTISPECIES: hypothetical protein [unclassified Azospirillum]KAA0571709.1 hypothetical protein FZ029_25825 [Azospirillum sp. Sh1]PWC67071.1 hypothetical protein TSH20_13720 [Azospirillum sp. TSH20]PWC68208.1 hypothetical protein TSH7_03060 [Azospirillum sp. TSH7]QCG97991.1 hypothetical protein E6C67_30285 [Azospirillum sp. TSA2s]
MDIGSAIGPGTTATPYRPQASALDGLQDAQARTDAASEQIAAGNLDPAVVLDLTSAQVDFAANAKVLQATQENSRRLLDMLA